MSEQGFPVGYHIQEVRSLTDEEMAREGWHWSESAVALQLSDGSVLFASKDYSGSEPGVLSGRLATGERFTVG